MSGGAVCNWCSKTAAVQTRRLSVHGGNYWGSWLQGGDHIWSAAVIKDLLVMHRGCCPPTHVLYTKLRNKCGMDSREHWNVLRLLEKLEQRALNFELFRIILSSCLLQRILSNRCFFCRPFHRFEMLDAARNKIRVKAAYLMMAATIGACVVMVVMGKRVSNSGWIPFVWTHCFSVNKEGNVIEKSKVKDQLLYLVTSN